MDFKKFVVKVRKRVLNWRL